MRLLCFCLFLAKIRQIGESTKQKGKKITCNSLLKTECKLKQSN